VTHTCFGGAFVGDTCAPGDPVAETCNSIDDDCDSEVDEDPGLTRICYPPLTGGCVFSDLTQTFDCQGLCMPGTLPCLSTDACFTAVTPTEQVCDARDHNCDGIIDDDEDTQAPTTTATVSPAGVITN
jgi:hypothetical protein